MAAEFSLRFDDPSWISEHRHELIEQIEALPTHVRSDAAELWLLGLEARDSTERWQFDARVFLKPESSVSLELSAHPPSLERDLKLLFAWLRSRTALSIVDDDGEPTGW